MATLASATREHQTNSTTAGPMSEVQFVEWCKDDMWAEWVDGQVVVMNAVSLSHHDMYQFISEIIIRFARKLDLGRVLNEPFQIRLPRQRRRRSPDIAFVSSARLTLLAENQFNGGPDLIVEIVSPESQVRDRTEKFAEYQTAGVTEYWLVDPTQRQFHAYFLNNSGKYELLAVVDGAVYSQVLLGVFFRPEWVYQITLPEIDTLLARMIRLRKKRLSSRRRRRSDNQS